jgi:hypothetical protein
MWGYLVAIKQGNLFSDFPSYILFLVSAVTLAQRFKMPPVFILPACPGTGVSRPYDTKLDYWHNIKLQPCKLTMVRSRSIISSSLISLSSVWFYVCQRKASRCVESCGLSCATCDFECRGRRFGSCLRIPRVRLSSWGTIWAEYPSGCWFTLFDCPLEKDVWFKSGATLFMTPRSGDSFQLKGKRIVVSVNLHIVCTQLHDFSVVRCMSVVGDK